MCTSMRFSMKQYHICMYSSVQSITNLCTIVQRLLCRLCLAESVSKHLFKLVSSRKKGKDLVANQFSQIHCVGRNIWVAVCVKIQKFSQIYISWWLYAYQNPLYVYRVTCVGRSKGSWVLYRAQSYRVLYRPYFNFHKALYSSKHNFSVQHWIVN